MSSEISPLLSRCNVSSCRYEALYKTDCNHCFCSYHITKISKENEGLICQLCKQVIDDCFQLLEEPSKYKTKEMIERDIRISKAIMGGCACCCCFLGALGLIVMILK